MAAILGLVTINGKDLLEVDVNPASGGGTPAPVGSLALLNESVAEVSRFIFSQAGSFYDVVGAAKALQLYNFPAVGHYFWFSVTGGANTQTDPALVGVGHQVAVLPGDTAAQVATALFAAVAAVVADFTAINSVSAQVDVTNTVGGNVTDSSASGSAAAASVLTQGSEIGRNYIKIGAADTAWDTVSTNTTSGVKQGNFLQLPIYDTSPNGYSVDDIVQQNGQNVSVGIVTQAGRTAPITYFVPNPGNAVTSADFVLTEGAQTINGNKTFGNNVIVQGDFTVNGTLTFLNSTDTDITDKNITLNKGGAAASGGGAGFSIEENAVLTGYFKVAADRNGYELLAPNVAFKNDLDLSNLTAGRVQKFADASGTFVMRPDGTPGVAGQVAFYSDANNINNVANLFWDNANSRLGIGTNAPSQALHVVGNARITGLSAVPGVVHNDANGNLSSSAVSLTADVSGILPIAQGGTNSGTTLNNDRIMYSSAGAVVEYAALVPSQVYFGAPTTGLPAQDISLFWDNTNKRLGIAGGGSPARALDVSSSVVFRGAMLLNDFTDNLAKWEAVQRQVLTTDATVTNIASIAIATDTMAVIEAHIVARRTSGAGASGDSAVYVRTAKFKNVAGTVSLANLQTDYTSEDVPSWNGTMSASGANAILSVKGAAATNVTWTVTYFIQTL